jgi:hypothetical protein
MLDALVTLIVDESKWLTVSMGLALIAATALWYRFRHTEVAGRRVVLAAMCLFFGVMVGTMAFGHLLAVTTKLALGSLQGSILTFYAIGTALALPSWWLVYHTRAVLGPDDGYARTTLTLNAWLAVTLLALGLHNLPLAAPAFFNIAYHLHHPRRLGWAIVGTTIAVNVGLFIGSLIFLASGQSFEQFSGMR